MLKVFYENLLFLIDVCLYLHNFVPNLAGLLYKSSIRPVRLQEGTTTSQVGWPWSGPRTMKAASALTRAASMSGMPCRTWSPPALTLQLCLLTSQFSVLLWKVDLVHKRNPLLFLLFLWQLISFLYLNAFECFSSIFLVKMLSMKVLPTSPLCCPSCIVSGVFTAGLETSSPFSFSDQLKGNERNASLKPNSGASWWAKTWKMWLRRR